MVRCRNHQGHILYRLTLPSPIGGRTRQWGCKCMYIQSTQLYTNLHLSFVNANPRSKNGNRISVI